MTTRGACHVTVDPEAERGIAHVVFSAARPQGGTVTKSHGSVLLTSDSLSASREALDNTFEYCSGEWKTMTNP